VDSILPQGFLGAFLKDLGTAFRSILLFRFKDTGINIDYTLTVVARPPASPDQQPGEQVL
jgi:hypothetical protein